MKLLLSVLLLSTAASAQTVLQYGIGANTHDHLGFAIADAGDVNGDGVRDVIVGAPYDDNAGGVDAGAAYVHSGASGALLRSWFGANGVGNPDQFGFAVAGIGDYDGDGRADVAVGAPGDDGAASGTEQCGSVTVFSGANGSVLLLLRGPTRNNYLGWSVSGAGRVNADARDDFVVGSADASTSTSPGFALVVAGGSGSLLGTLVGDDPFDGFGRAVAGVGDVDGDGRADVAVGAPFDDDAGTNAGLVRVFAGPWMSELYTLRGDANAWQFGAALSRAGDVDGDGLADLVVGAPGAWPAPSFAQTGVARVVRGSTGATIRTHAGAQGAGQFGFSVASAGDVNGDGRADVIVGAPYENAAAVGSGNAHVYSGLDGARLLSWANASSSLGNEARWGWSVAALGDVNGDGLSDLLAGAPEHDQNGQNSGSWWLFSSTPYIERLCFGDGAGTACPCGNSGAAGNGCANSASAGGAGLSASGTASLGADSLTLSAYQMPLSTSLFVQATETQNGGMGLVSGDGLLCVGGAIVRLGTQTNVGGIVGLGTSSYPAAGTPTISVRGGIATPGTTRYYQVRYRNSASYCTPETFNLTNAVRVVWGL